MMNQKLTDREEQVCIAALFYFLNHVQFWSQGKNYRPVNEHDILAPGHTKAHIITAIQKLCNTPIAHAFQSPNLNRISKEEAKRQETIIHLRHRLMVDSYMTNEQVDELFTTLQIIP